MAVPKKRTSKAKKNIRKARWKRKAFEEGKKALSLAFSALTKKESDTDLERKISKS